MSLGEKSLVRELNARTEEVLIKEQKAYLLFKRVFDILCAIIGLLILSVLFFIIGFLIKLEDKRGSVFFKQTRIGKDGKPFEMYKFRSMVSNAEDLKASLMDKNEATGPVFKIKDDPRVTRVGKFIRKTSIDELPQLINVIKGEMSLVGPRPSLPQEVAAYSSYERQRLKVVPGITCYWQVGGRSNLSFSEWVELDLKYIRERNLFIDFKLIIKTFFVLFGSKDAY
ncbi:sugar transferase [Niallia circulans]|uniref:sugar transferase n=1 Tax=Niallia sp. FSL M8-0099 TaxID=2954519 RepID=UPI00077C8509|nr:sugar transferase [Niallia circulans]MDR4317711.1 sugar transferase [Niallia circulans]MED3841155.1 sugar transferase [Niallia circulans]MED4245732.1 sugar transferase [Niallia circulans]MED4247686.1 sugar transferase [Niallia circulans]QKH63379.1 sugar transferase [Niallia circulans]